MQFVTSSTRQTDRLMMMMMSLPVSVYSVDVDWSSCRRWSVSTSHCHSHFTSVRCHTSQTASQQVSNALCRYCNAELLRLVVHYKHTLTSTDPQSTFSSLAVHPVSIFSSISSARLYPSCSHAFVSPRCPSLPVT